MPQAGAVRINPQTQDWERFNGSRWVPLSANDPVRVQLDALEASSLFDRVKNDADGEVGFHRAGGGDSDSDWLYWDEALETAQGTGAGTSAPVSANAQGDSVYGPAPKDWPSYEPWPPMRFETVNEARAAGHFDQYRNPEPRQVVDTKAVTAARQAEKSAAEKEAKAKAEADKFTGFPTSAAAREAASSDPALAGYRPKYISGTGQWQLVPPDETLAPVAQEAAQLEAEANLVRQQQQAAQAGKPPSFDDVILDALLNGQEEKAMYFASFQERPTRLQALAFAMQWAETPEEFDALFEMAQGPALDYAEQQPVFTQARAAILGGLPPSLGGMQAPPTTAELQADAASQSVRFTPEGSTQRWDRNNQVWVDVNLPDATSRPTANGGLLPIPTPSQGKGPFMPGEPTFAEEESSFSEPYVPPPPKPPAETPINNQEFDKFAAAGPDLGDLPSAEEMRIASLRSGGKGVVAPPGVLIPDFVKNSPNTISFYNPDKQNQFYDFVNEFREQAFGSKAGQVTVPEGVSEDDIFEAKAAQLGIPNYLRRPKPQDERTFRPPASVFNRKKPAQPQATFRTPRYIGAR